MPRSAWQLWGACGLLALIVLALYTLPAWQAAGEPVLPLDDVYIHFQYARQIAAGELYQYNPGQPPSSGATSLIYPYLLAVGYRLGFSGLSLGLWALGWGWIALTLSLAMLTQLIKQTSLPRPLTLAFVLTFAATGFIGWHYASGMETGLLTAWMLVTLYGVYSTKPNITVMGACLMAVTRPEGGIMAVIVVAALLWQQIHAYRKGEGWVRATLWRVLPVLALGLQPLINWLITGEREAAGSDAKSLLGMIPQDYTVIIPRIVGNFARLWLEFASGYSPREGLYLPIPLLLLAVIGWVWLWRKQWITAALILLWLGAGTAAVSTLDPAFWHFKRYQVPFMVLLFPLAGWGIAALWSWRKPAAWGASGLLLVSALVSSGVYFQPAYGLNVSYLTRQQIPMARWIDANLPSDAVLAVHDVGIVRYLGGRTTVDMVGLTTAGAADSWRNGPGALAEFLGHTTPRPTYIASYTDALGLSYLADSPIYGEALVTYPLDISERYNVALAGRLQGVWRADWSMMDIANQPYQPYIVGQLAGLTLSDSVNVAELASETAHTYMWEDRERLDGFPSELYALDYAACNAVCRIMDGGRRINGRESFTLHTRPNQDLLLVTRLHPAQSGTLRYEVNGEHVAVRVIPSIPGRWIDIAMRVDGARIGEQTTITVLPEVVGGHYMPYYHWAYQGEFAAPPTGEPLAVFADHIGLYAAESIINGDQLTLTLTWGLLAPIRTDARLFVHLYDDLNAPPIAQVDRYPIDGATPPGNWLPDQISDTIALTLGEVPDGRYTLALGLYQPSNGERLPITVIPSPNFSSNAGRLLLGMIEVQHGG